MKIKTRFYYHNKGRYFDYGGWMVISNRNLIQLGSIPVEEGGRPFYYDDTFYTITYEHKERRGVVDANRIITESSYKTTQLEYVVKLNWIQQQKLRWMFRRHWLQQPGNIVHLFILVLIITLAFMGFELIQHTY